MTHGGRPAARLAAVAAGAIILATTLSACVGGNGTDPAASPSSAAESTSSSAGSVAASPSATPSEQSSDAGTSGSSAASASPEGQAEFDQAVEVAQMIYYSVAETNFDSEFVAVRPDGAEATEIEIDGGPTSTRQSIPFDSRRWSIIPVGTTEDVKVQIFNRDAVSDSGDYVNVFFKRDAAPTVEGSGKYAGYTWSQ